MFDAELVNLLLLTDVLQYSCSEKCCWVNRKIILLDLFLINMQQAEVFFEIVVLKITENPSLTPSNPILDTYFWGCSRMVEQKGPRLPKMSHISYNNET